MDAVLLPGLADPRCDELGHWFAGLVRERSCHGQQRFLVTVGQGSEQAVRPPAFAVGRGAGVGRPGAELVDGPLFGSAPGLEFFDLVESAAVRVLPNILDPQRRTVCRGGFRYPVGMAADSGCGACLLGSRSVQP